MSWWATATTPPLDQTKTCCAAAYGSDIVDLLLGNSYHPGGLALTSELATQLGVPRGRQVLDIASGRGATAMLLAADFGLQVAGLDLSPANVVRAQVRATAAGLADQVCFIVGDAERLPYADAAFDAVVVECALSTFPDKRAAVSEIVRVLRPGGKLGLTDVVADPCGLPSALTTIAARIACVADALPLHGYADLLRDAGLRTTRAERHDAAAANMIDQIEARLAIIRLTARAHLEEHGIDLDRTRLVLKAARAAVTDGVLGYGLLVADKPTL